MNNIYLFLITRGQKIILALMLILIADVQQVKAAEFIVLKYGFLRDSLSVPELSTFAETGEMSSSISSYLDLAHQKPDNVREILNKKIPVNGVLLSKILNSKPGGVFLDIVAKYIQTPSGRASRESLRGAFVTSALDDNNIKLIEIIENYPTNEIHIEGDRLGELYTNIEKVIKQIPSILN